MYRRITPIFLNFKSDKLCLTPYPNHKKGCPNYNKKEGCPPTVRPLDEVFDFEQPIYAIWNIFDFKKHTDKMREKHPNWSERQIECCLYWQGSARKQLKKEIELFITEFPNYHVKICPEAHKINITETMKLIGEHLEWPPKMKTYQIALAGILL